MGLLAPGAVVAGCRIESVVGRGGMGVVYRARELELGRVVALKLIAPELLADAGIRERFLHEARIAAAIEHPNVVPVYAAGEREGSAFLVMRFIEGADLRTLVLRDGPLAAGRAADIIGWVAAGLDVIHRAGYVHRDVKPANVLVDRDGHVYVADFGLAKHALSRGATASGHWVGTLDYVAPEQVRGGQVDARADVYALGGVLCFVLTGQVPFERDGDEAKLWAQLSAPPPHPSQLRAGVPRAFDSVIERAMAKAPERRYPSAGDLGRAAVAAASGGAPSAPERMVARGAAAPGGKSIEYALGPDGSTVTAPGPEPKPVGKSRRSFRRRVGPLALAGLVVAAAIIAVVVISRDAPRTRSGATIRVAETIDDVGRRPNGVAVVGGVVWVTSAELPRVERIDGVTGRDMDQRPLVGLGASSIVSAGSSVWVAARRAQRVVQIDARSGRVIRRLRPGGPPRRLAVGLGSVWVATLADAARGAQLVRYDHAGNEQYRWAMPRGVAALATGADFVWIAERDVTDVVRLDPRTGKITEWAPLVGPPTGLYYGGGYVWATMPSEDSIARINPRRAGSPVTTAAGHEPTQVVMAGGHLFVASNTDHSVRVLNPNTGRQARAPLIVANNPYAITADEDAVWVTGISENTLTRIVYR